MSVKAILNEKGSNVITVTAQVTVQQAASLLHENHIGAVVVVDPEEHIVGIMTERDIVASIARYGAAASTSRFLPSCGRTSIAVARKCPSTR